MKRSRGDSERKRRGGEFLTLVDQRVPRLRGFGVADAAEDAAARSALTVTRLPVGAVCRRDILRLRRSLRSWIRSWRGAAALEPIWLRLGLRKTQCMPVLKCRLCVILRGWSVILRG